MSRIWFLADTHLGIKNDNQEWLDNMTGYFNDVVIPLMKKEYKDGDILIHLGDVFDNRSTVGLNTICATIDIFEEFSKIFKDIRIIVGNHDIYNKSTNDITSIKMLSRIPNITIYYEPIIKNICGKNILFNPWVNELEDENKLLSSVDVDYIFGHLDVVGCILNSKGVKSMSSNSIESKNFKNSIVYAGHIHKRQDYGNVHYVGSPYQTNKGDSEDLRGITILDIETGETTFFENTYSPKFKIFSIYEILDKTIGELKEEWKNCFIDLRVKGDDVIQCKFDILMEELTGFFKEFSIHHDNNESIINNKEDGSDLSERKSTEEYVKEWLDDNDVLGKRYETVFEMFKQYKEGL